MPNLVPPVTTVAAALAYKERLLAIEPNVNYLMTLYLHESITPETVREAKKAGIVGIKSYPAGSYSSSKFFCNPGSSWTIRSFQYWEPMQYS
jgi:dihydroorotase